MRVLLASGAGLYADALAHWLRALSSDIRLIRCGTNATLLPRGRGVPELALINVDDVPGKRAPRVIEDFRARFPKTRLVALGSPKTKKFAAMAIKAGADAYLPKSHDETKAVALLEAMVGVTLRQPGAAVGESNRSSQKGAKAESLGASRSSEGAPYGLTSRELDMLELACFGLSNLEIAKRHKISVGVVKLHLHHAYEKLGVQGRVQAIHIVENLDEIRALQVQRAESEPALLDYLVPHMSHERHRKGHVLFRKGEPGNAMYYVQRGRVGLPEIGASMSDGEIFGELGIFSPSHARTSSALCEVDTDLFVLTADQTRRLCFENPQFAYYVIRLIADRLVGERTRKWGQTP
jgi:two-component system, NarL family, nitrate/nitrite response regulator NarL